MRSESITAVAAAILGTILFTLLLVTGYMTAGHYSVLLCVVVLASLALHGFDRLGTIDFKNMRAELHQVRSDIYAKAEEVRELSLNLVELIMFNSALKGRYATDESIKLEAAWNKLKCNEILQLIGAFDDVSWRRVSRIANAFEALDFAPPEQRESFPDPMQVIREDIKEMEQRNAAKRPKFESDTSQETSR